MTTPQIDPKDLDEAIQDYEDQMTDEDRKALEAYEEDS
jgi:hypothetical protein